MQTLIFRNLAPKICALMVLVSIFVCLRGHNEPGGGFIGGLIAASAFAVYGLSNGIMAVRKALVFEPMKIAGSGLFFGALTGVVSAFFGDPFFTGQWVFLEILGVTIGLSTPMFFDIGVYFVVLGAVTSLIIALEEDGD